jgi:hypothetical protein
MSTIEFTCHPDTPKFIKKWRNNKYIAEGKRRGATHVVTVWDSTDMEIVKQEYVMPHESVEVVRKRIGGAFSVGEVLTVT